MLSVLIPVYNFDITQLVNSLHLQLMSAKIPFEIILGDDASPEVYQNKALSALTGVQYTRYENNLGRSKIRNTLAKRAQYPYLLFMDCDAAVASTTFIDNYLQKIREIEEDIFVINGGIGYRSEPPEKNQHLRWFYGKQREQLEASVRDSHPYRSFTPFNVLMTKKIFATVIFDESFTTYGHEDTLFGLALAKNNIHIYHINNILYHDGLDENEIYLQKIENAIHNLVMLQWDDDIIRDNRLIRTYLSLKKWHLHHFITLFFKPLKRKMEATLCRRPSLFLLDLYKLGLIASKSK